MPKNRKTEFDYKWTQLDYSKPLKSLFGVLSMFFGAVVAFFIIDFDSCFSFLIFVAVGIGVIAIKAAYTKPEAEKLKARELALRKRELKQRELKVTSQEQGHYRRPQQ
jgi:hypothetical protein